MRTPTHLFVNTAQVLKVAKTLDASRSPRRTYLAGETFACRFQTGGTGESRVEGAERTTGGATCYCSPSVKVTQADRISSGGREWEVVSVDSDELNVIQTLILEERR